MKKATLAAAAVALSVTGCATWGGVEQGLDTLLDQDLAAVVDRIGPPSSQQAVAGKQFYIWSDSHQSALTLPDYQTTTSYDAYGPYTSTTYDTETIPIHANCKLTLEVDDQDRVIDWRLYGNLYGCEKYAKLAESEAQ